MLELGGDKIITELFMVINTMEDETYKESIINEFINYFMVVYTKLFGPPIQNLKSDEMVSGYYYNLSSVEYRYQWCKKIIQLFYSRLKNIIPKEWYLELKFVLNFIEVTKSHIINLLSDISNEKKSKIGISSLLYRKNYNDNDEMSISPEVMLKVKQNKNQSFSSYHPTLNEEVEVLLKALKHTQNFEIEIIQILNIEEELTSLNHFIDYHKNICDFLRKIDENESKKNENYLFDTSSFYNSEDFIKYSYWNGLPHSYKHQTSESNYNNQILSVKEKVVGLNKLSPINTSQYYEESHIQHYDSNATTAMSPNPADSFNREETVNTTPLFETLSDNKLSTSINPVFSPIEHVAYKPNPNSQYEELIQKMLIETCLPSDILYEQHCEYLLLGQKNYELNEVLMLLLRDGGGISKFFDKFLWPYIHLEAFHLLEVMLPLTCWNDGEATQIILKKNDRKDDRRDEKKDEKKEEKKDEKKFFSLYNNSSSNKVMTLIKGKELENVFEGNDSKDVKSKNNTFLFLNYKSSNKDIKNINEPGKGVLIDKKKQDKIIMMRVKKTKFKLLMKKKMKLLIKLMIRSSSGGDFLFNDNKTQINSNRSILVDGKSKMMEMLEKMMKRPSISILTFGEKSPNPTKQNGVNEFDYSDFDSSGDDENIDQEDDDDYHAIDVPIMPPTLLPLSTSVSPRQNIKDENSSAKLKPIYPSSTRLVQAIKGSLNRCLSISCGLTLCHLSEVFKATIHDYLSLLAARIGITISLENINILPSEDMEQSENQTENKLGMVSLENLLVSTRHSIYEGSQFFNSFTSSRSVSSSSSSQGGASSVSPFILSTDNLALPFPFDSQTCCICINTFDYLLVILPQIHELFSSNIDPHLSNKINFKHEIDLIYDLLALSLALLVQKIFQNISSSFNLLVKVLSNPNFPYLNTSAMSTLNYSCTPYLQDDPEYLIDLAQNLLQTLPHLRETLLPQYFNNFCLKLATDILTLFFDCIKKQKKITEEGSQQLLLDTYTLKTLLMLLPTLQSIEEIERIFDKSPLFSDHYLNSPSIYTKMINSKIIIIENYLKLISTPPELLVDRFLNYFPDGQQSELLSLMSHRGVKKVDQIFILDKFKQKKGKIT